MESHKSTKQKTSILKKQSTVVPQTQAVKIEGKPVDSDEEEKTQSQINPNTGFSKESERQINKGYDEVADTDDVELTAWQRQLKVNKYMVDLQIRKMITTLLEPVYEGQEKIHETLLNIVGDRIVRVSDRVGDLEEILYRGETKNDRFTDLENRINSLQLGQNLFIQTIESQFATLQRQVSDVEYREATVLKRCSIVEE